MAQDNALNKVISLLGKSIEYDDHGLMVVDEEQARANIGEWARVSALESGEEQAWARYLTRLLALDLGAIPSSIHDLYLARGRGEVPRSSLSRGERAGRLISPAGWPAAGAARCRP